ncbi:MAG: hypothetical protein QXS91_00625 [Candidatus Anstonellales archaeon]
MKTLKRNTIGIINALLLLFLLNVNCYFAINALSYSLDKDSYEPGENGVITLNVNYTHIIAKDENLIGFELTSFDVIAGLFSKTIDIGRVQPGVVTYVIPFKAAYSSEGIYTIEIRINSRAIIERIGGIGSEPSNTVIYIPIKVLTKPVVDINVNPTNIKKQGQLNIEVCPQKGTVKQVFVSSSNLSMNDVIFDNLVSCKSKNVTYDASNLQEGVNNIIFTLKIKNAVDDIEIKNRTIPLTVVGWETGFIIKQKKELLYKESSNLEFEISNIGGEINDMSIEPFDGSGVIFESQNQIRVASIKQNETKTASIDVFVTLEPGQKLVPFVISWKQDGIQKREIINIPINIRSKDAVDVFINANPVPLIVGNRHSLSITISNKAGYKISGVSVKILSDELDVQDLTDTIFFGSFDPDDFTTRQVYVVPKKEGQGKITLNVSYLDPSNRLISEAREFQINIKKETQKQNNDLLIIALVIILIGIGYMLFLRKKK